MVPRPIWDHRLPGLGTTQRWRYVVVKGSKKAIKKSQRNHSKIAKADKIRKERKGVGKEVRADVEKS
jgi:hypothetical protein